jgi:nucleoside-diphosphate-sugar epimerase
VTTIAITGTTGYIGARLSAHLRDAGVTVVALNRRPSGVATEKHRAVTLGEPISDGVLAGVDALVHAAWSLGNESTGALRATNVDGSRALWSAAKTSGVHRVVFVSSMSAYDGTRQEYGAMKLEVEHAALDEGFSVARPGLVWGPGAGGMAATLSRIARMPVWPEFTHAALYTVYEAELVSALAVILDHYDECAHQVLGLAHATPAPLAAVLTALSPTGRPRPHIRVPAGAVIRAIGAATRLGATLPFRSDSLLGLTEVPPVPPGATTLHTLGVSFRPISHAVNSLESRS